MKMILSVVLAVALQMPSVIPSVHAQPTCRFVLGFADMVDYVGAAEVGPCLEDQKTTTRVERFAVDGFSSVEVQSGASVQWTGHGLLVWHQSDNTTQFYSRRGIWFRSASGSKFVSMAELTAPSAPAPAPTPDLATQVWSRCFEFRSDIDIRSLSPGYSTAERSQLQAESDAAYYLCTTAGDQDGLRGVDCFETAWPASRGMERTFPGSGRKAYDDAYRSCINRR